jgi:transposase
MALVGLKQVADHHGASRETVRLWVTRGVWAGGRLFRLEARWVAGRWLTRPRWVREFLERVTAARAGSVSPETWAAERETALERLGGEKRGK